MLARQLGQSPDPWAACAGFSCRDGLQGAGEELISVLARQLGQSEEALTGYLSPARLHYIFDNLAALRGWRHRTPPPRRQGTPLAPPTGSLAAESCCSALTCLVPYSVNGRLLPDMRHAAGQAVHAAGS